MLGEHDVAGAIPVIPTKLLETPSFRGTGHDSAKIVGRGSIPLDGTNGPLALRYRLLIDLAQLISFARFYVAVWDGSGVQSRGAVFDSLAACRRPTGCSSAWQSARFGTERSKVQVLLPRRQRFACSLSSERAAVRRDSRWRHLWPFGTAPLL